MLGLTLPALLGIVLKCENYLQTTPACSAKRPFLRQCSVIYASFKTALIAPQYLV